jgi:hypothetical protein
LWSRRSGREDGAKAGHGAFEVSNALRQTFIPHITQRRRPGARPRTAIDWRVIPFSAWRGRLGVRIARIARSLVVSARLAFVAPGLLPGLVFAFGALAAIIVGAAFLIGIRLLTLPWIFGWWQGCQISSGPGIFC